MLTGSLAAAFYGPPRATQDIDMVIEAGPREVERLVEELREAGLYVSRAAYEAFENSGQINAIDPETGWKADLVFRKERAFSREEFGRRQSTQLLGVDLSLARLEDLIIAQLEWSVLGDSELQRRDVVSLLNTGVPIDRLYIEQWTAELGLAEAWARVRDRRVE
jgi:hypothetical protein